MYIRISENTNIFIVHVEMFYFIVKISKFYHLDFFNLSVYYSITELKITKVRPNDVLTLTRHEGVLQDGV